VAAPVRRRGLRLRFGAKNIPHPNKAHYGGEDAFFVSDAGAGLAGIADGVGGWQEAGVNPADYSRKLMTTAKQFLEECATLYPEGSIDVLSSADWLAAQPESTEFAAAAADQARRASLAGSADEEGMGGVQPPAPSLTSSSMDGPRTAVEALDVAHRTTLMPGSSTACVVRLVPSSESGKALLDAANLGDSGFLLIRDGRLHFQSPAMQHFFDCPLQFGLPPDTDWARDAAVFQIEVLPGDVLVLATDGLLDNLYPEDIVALAPRSPADVEQAAAAMAAAASRNASDPTFESPYTAEAREEGYDIPIWEKLMSASFKDGKFELGKLRGGKQDDITVICAYVVDESAH
jgi:protein phosphatase PTC7